MWDKCIGPSASECSSPATPTARATAYRRCLSDSTNRSNSGSPRRPPPPSSMFAIVPYQRQSSASSVKSSSYDEIDTILDDILQSSSSGPMRAQDVPIVHEPRPPIANDCGFPGTLGACNKPRFRRSHAKFFDEDLFADHLPLPPNVGQIQRNLGKCVKMNGGTAKSKQKLDAAAPIANASQSKGTDKSSSKKKGDVWELKKAKCTACKRAKKKLRKMDARLNVCEN